VKVSSWFDSAMNVSSLNRNSLTSMAITYDSYQGTTSVVPVTENNVRLHSLLKNSTLILF
jgi:hypothetical protein